MSRPLALILSLVLVLSAAPARSYAADSKLRTVRVVAHGVQLTLSMAGDTYPRNALVRVTVRLENVARHPIGVWTTGDPEFNGVIAPQPQVLDRAGKVVYPPALSYLPENSPSPPPHPELLNPTITLQLRTYVVLRGTRLRAIAFAADSPGDTSSHLRVATPFLSVKLTRPDAPRAVLQTYRASPPRPLAATFFPRSRVQGPMLYMGSADCYYPDSNVAIMPTGVGTWWYGSSIAATALKAGSGTRLVPRCQTVTQVSPPRTFTGTLLQWHVVAGWPGHSVRVFDYPAGWIPPGEISP